MNLLFIVQTDSKEFGLCTDVGAGGDEEGKMDLEGSWRRPSGPASYSARPFGFALPGAD